MTVPQLSYNVIYQARMRDCFTGGYTLPQYCIDNGIKKPLFVADKESMVFMWEVYAQFRYDKRMLPTFSMIDLPTDAINLSIYYTIYGMNFINFSEINPNDYDKIIMFTRARIPVKDNVITFYNLTEYFVRKTYAEIPALSFLQRHPGVKLFYTILPNRLDRYEGGKEFAEECSKRYGQTINKLRARKDEIIPTPFDKFGYTNEEITALWHVSGKITANLDGTTVMPDNDHPLVQIKNHKRETAYQPEKFRNRIYFVGPCHFVGNWASYDRTIESYLQQMLNEHDLPYRVENESQGCAGRYQDMFYNLNALNPAPGDIIFLWITRSLHADNNVPYLDLSDAFDPPYDYKDFFWIEGHFNEAGYKRIAERFFELLTENNFFRDKDFNYTPPPLHRTAMASHRNSSKAA